jgi:hypothetical protein
MNLAVLNFPSCCSAIRGGWPLKTMGSNSSYRPWNSRRSCATVSNDHILAQLVIDMYCDTGMVRNAYKNCMSYFLIKSLSSESLTLLLADRQFDGTNVDAELHLSLPSDSDPWPLPAIPMGQLDKELEGGARAGVFRVPVGGSMQHVNDSPASEFSLSQLS